MDRDELKLITQETQELEVVTDKNKYYRVQFGAFSKKENAEALLKKIKAFCPPSLNFQRF
ncbi:SPOR domain-containing protein [Candidatus Contubernalis alkalaceticus]|nr:SPOR domain-containing protein [Candidatus Contubernalis alkalaceticus]